MISDRLASDVARHAGNASAAALYRAIDLIRAREIDLVGLYPCRRVEDGPVRPGLPKDDLPTDVVTDPLHRSHSRAGSRDAGHDAGRPW